MLDEFPVLPEEPSLAAGVLEDLSHLLNALAGGDLLEAGASKLWGEKEYFITSEVASPILFQKCFHICALMLSLRAFQLSIPLTCFAAACPASALTCRSRHRSLFVPTSRMGSSMQFSHG